MWTPFTANIWIGIAILSLEKLQPIGCNFNFYIDARESRILYGLDSKEIYFIRNGLVNQNTILFLREDIPPHVDEISFHWHLSEYGVNTSYYLQINTPPGPIMDPPVLNISSNGFLPSRDTTFAISLPCTGRVRDHVNVLVKMTFITKFNRDNEPLSLNFKRRKLCKKRSNYPMDSRTPQIESSNDLVLPIQKLSPFASSAIVIASASTSIILLLFLVGLIYATRKKRQPSTAPSSLVHLDYMPHTYLHEDKSSHRFPSNGISSSSGGTQVSFLNSCSKSLSLHFRSNSEQSRRLLQNYSSLSSASNTIYKYLPNRDETLSISPMGGPRSLIIEDGVLKLSSSNATAYPTPPPPPPPSLTLPNISSEASSSISSSSLSLHAPLEQSQEPPSLSSMPPSLPSSLSSTFHSNSSNELFPNGETLGIQTHPTEASELSKDEGSSGPDVNYLPHLYPHLIPKNKLKPAT